ncbi:MAG TPA: phosphate signaling complex protein PhoU [Thermoguttaceae bacterium]|nr:phosphate signaling complex protein PhoU [Thermoguttaceae bacterium]
MSVHLQREIDRIKQRLLSLSALVEQQLQLAVRSILDSDEEMATAVCERDREIDQMEVEIEEECLKTLALHQPVAIDLRFLVAVLKINNDLERIGDLAVNIAHKAKKLVTVPSFEVPFDLTTMWERTQAMLRDAIDALVNMDPALADDVCTRDDAIDQMKRDVRHLIEDMIRDDPQRVTPLSTLMAVSRNLERVADHATNIAEDVIYMIRGRIIRHGEFE